MTLTPGTLVLYKQKPARVVGAGGDKLDIETAGGPVRVRPKDVLALHPGPVTSLPALRPPAGEPAEVWQLMEGTPLPLADVAELAFGSFTPESALAVWQWLQDGTYFGGSPSEVRPRSPEAVEVSLRAQRERASEARAWEDFIAALRRGELLDRSRLGEVEALALGRSQKSKVLAALGRPETPAQAHALLLSLKVWNEERDPYPARFGVDTRVPDLPLPPLPGEARLDLTHLDALAIDDEGSSDPDDAISLERLSSGYRLWVHVADAAALVRPGSELDADARRRGATLYLPEGTVPMLPQRVTDMLGLGLREVSPALSFALDLDEDFGPLEVAVHLTRVRVRRLTYAQAQDQLAQPPLSHLAAFARAARERREAAGAVPLDLPEVRVRLVGGQVRLTPLPPLESRAVVQEAMMLAGWGAATWAEERGLALPFAAQDGALERVAGSSLSAQWARRKTLARTRFAPRPGRHAGLGLEPYAQATSPLRRYLDLVVHQQLRAELAGERPLSGAEIAARAAEAGLSAGNVRAAERAANHHWTLVFLRHHPYWRGRGSVVERRGHVATVLLPELALDAQLPLPNLLDEELCLSPQDVDLPNLQVRWRVVDFTEE